MCAGRATAHEKRMDNHDPAQPPRTGAEKMKKIGDIKVATHNVPHNVENSSTKFQHFTRGAFF